MGAPSASSRTSTPDRVGPYEILLPIASGGMATVYLARATGVPGMPAEVALKLTHAHLRTSAEFANGLLEEGKLAARIRHPNVVSVLDVGDDPHGVYLVMEYVDGDTLAGVTRGAGAMPVAMGARLLVDALAGLHAAHELCDEGGAPAGVVHRDFTPQNILVGADGVARLADFGIAKAATRVGYTRTGIVKGKIAYMSPEQAHGKPLDRRCDVWAAGVVAWEIFAGRRMHAHDDDVATLLKVATLPPPLLRSVAPHVPEAVEAAVAAALEMDVERRVATAEELAARLADACRATLGLAELDAIARWMGGHVKPRVSGQRLQAARSRAIRADYVRTRVETPAAGGAHSAATKTVPSGETEEISVHTATAEPLAAATVLIPTVAAEPGTLQLTDGVSVVTRGWKTARSVAVARRGRVAGAVAAAVVLASLVVWRVSASGDKTDARPPPATSAALEGALLAPSAGAGSPPAASPARTLRLRANAVIASVRVDDRSVPLTRAGTTVEIRLAEPGQTSALTIDAVATDGRRAAVVVPADATEVSLEFPARGALPFPVRPAAARPPAAAPPAAAPAAPLAPSPY
ncbi:MAG TPA: serine/threonine-protein kinase [Polyangiaceae bacterium]